MFLLKRSFLKVVNVSKQKNPTYLLYRLAATVVNVEKFENIQLKNEPLLEYLSGSEERAKLEQELTNMLGQVDEVPLVIDGKEMISDNVCYQIIPHKHSQNLCKYYQGDEDCIKAALEAAVKAQKKWDETSFTHRMAIWERAADLMATKYRAQLVAATMLGQGKTVMQGEIDAALELIDFIRMNVGFLKQNLNYQPFSPNEKLCRNFLRYRGMEGVVCAISPFNFTAIGGNLAYTPALMGNGVVWKPSDMAVYSSYLVFKIMREAGVPDGVVNFCPANGPTFARVCAECEQLTGINFTGSVPVFQSLWKEVANNIDCFKTYPRLVGECGGKNFHFVHPSANVCAVVSTAIRAAFEYSGQKCSACSRIYVPESLWESKIKKRLIDKTKKLKVGDVTEFDSFTSTVINEQAFLRIVRYIENARISKPMNNIIVGGKYQNLRGYFIEPTIIESSDPYDVLFRQEIFGPLLAVYVYKDNEMKKIMDMIVSTATYALTASIFAEDEKFLKEALIKFRNIAGNLYINDKCTGSVVGQQPFGGARLSGTNDKAGSPQYLLRWTSPLAIKETYEPQMLINYPYMKS